MNFKMKKFYDFSGSYNNEYMTVPYKYIDEYLIEYVICLYIKKSMFS